MLFWVTATLLTAIPSFAGQYAVTRRALALLPSLSRLGLGRLAPGNAALIS